VCLKAPLWDLYCSIYLCLILAAKIALSEFLPYVDDVSVIKSAEDGKLPQSEIGSVQKWCIKNYVKINILKTNCIHFNFYVGDVPVSLA
jgi:hypothetical protein